MYSLKSLKADLKRENDGDFVDIPDNPGLRFKVRSLNYAPYVAARSALQQKWERKYGKNLPQDVFLKDMGEILADHIVLDWEGLDEDYSPDLAKEILTDPAYRTIVEFVIYAASKIGVVTAEFIEEAAKN